MQDYICSCQEDNFNVISKLFLYLTGKFPKMRIAMWRWMYNLFAARIRNKNWRFMNFGYAYPEGEQISIPMLEEDRTDKYSWQLYEHMIRQHAPTHESAVLEVGSGRGGACYLTHKYFKPAMVTGVDLSDKAVEFCKSTYEGVGLTYLVGEASHLPLPDGVYDIVMNAESSHAYPDFEGFLAEVKRVLKPGGHFMTTDNRKAELVDIWKSKLADSGMAIVFEADITERVLQSLDEQEERKEQLIREHVPSFFKKQFREFAGMKGSVMYNDFKNRNRIYKTFILQKI